MKIISYLRNILILSFLSYCSLLFGQPLVVTSMPSWTNNQKESNVAVGQPVIVWGSYFGGSGTYSSVSLTVDGGVALPNNDPNPCQNFASGHYWGNSYTFTTCGLHHVSIKVTDSNGNTDSSTSVVYAHNNPSDTIKVDMMIDKGLLFLYKNAIIAPATSYGDSTVYWNDNSGNNWDEWSFAATSTAVIALEEGSHFRTNTIPPSTGGCGGTTTYIDPYTMVVREGLNYLMSTYADSIAISDHGGFHSDVSGDGEGKAVFPALNYANSLGLYAVVMSMNDSAQAASTQITYGPFAGQSFYHFMRDCLDLLLWDQGDGGCYLGNWRYDPMTYNVAGDDGYLDGSTQQWPILALWASQSRWGMKSPQWAMNNVLYAYSQMTSSGACSGDCDAGACVSPYVCDYNLGVTGGMLAAYAWAGKMFNSGDVDAINSVNYIESVYVNDGAGANVLNSGWGGYFYGMYGLKKGLYLQNIDTINVGGTWVNWYFNEASWLSGNNVYVNSLPSGFAPGTPRDLAHCYGQNSDGSWTGNPSYWISDNPIATGWALLLLRPNLTPQPMPVPAQSFNICPGDTAWLFASDSAVGGYSWYPTTGLNNPNIRNPIATPTSNTNYYVNYIDAQGCPYKYEYSYVCVKNKPVLTVSNNTAACIGNPVTLNVISSSEPFTWSNGSTNNQIIVDTSVTSVIWVTTQPNIFGCFATDSITVTINPLPIVSVTPANTSICTGNSTTLTASGASTYSWNNGLGSGNSFILSPSSTTTYTVTGTDINGCVGTAATATVTVNPLPPAYAGPDKAICIGSNTNLNATGGIVYEWSPASGLSNSTIQSPVANPTTTTIYDVTVTDVNGCSATSGMTLTVNSLPIASAGTNQIICDGQSANLTAFGGVTYNWSNSATSQSINVSPATTTTFSVTVTDVNGCAATSDVQVSVNPLPPASAGSNQAICYGFNTTLSGSGGTAYVWSPTPDLSNPNISNPVAAPTSTTTYTVTVTDANGCSATNDMVLTVYPQMFVAVSPDQTICMGQSASLNASGGALYSWSPGTGLSSTSVNDPIATPASTTSYTVTVDDGHGCTKTAGMTVTVNPVPTSSFTVSSPICLGQTSTITYTGSGTGLSLFNWNFAGGNIVSGAGSGPYQISWDSASTYNISLLVTENGCTSDTTSVQQIVGHVTTSISVIDSIQCNGMTNGQVNVTPTGASPFQYQWSNAQTAQTDTNLSANILYTVTVTDSYGCSASQSIILSEPQPLAMNFNFHDASCFGNSNGSANAQIIGGTQPYIYIWTPSGTAGNISSVSTLKAGSYSLTVQDDHGCIVDTGFTINQPPLLTFSYVTDSVSCFSGTNGSITINVNGGTLPYLYTWNPGVSTSSSVTNISSGTYLVTIADHNGCDTVANINVGEPNQLTINTSGNISICTGQSTTISATASGGTGNYVYTWNNGLGNGSTFVVTPTATTTYTVYVTDGNSCISAPQSFTVSVSPPIHVNVIANPAAICQENNATLIASANGGVGNLIYTWGQGIGVSSSTITVTPSSTTMYPVTVSDNCGSPVGIDSVEVTVYPLPNILFSADTTRGCIPLGIIFADSTTPAIASWLWNFGDSASGTNNISNLQNPSHLFTMNGTYNVTLSVVTTNGCTGSYTYQNMITVYPTPLASFTSYPSPSNILNPNIRFTNNSIGASAWNWNFGDPATGNNNVSNLESPQHDFSNTGFYTVTLLVTSQYNCVDSTQSEVTIDPVFTFYIPNAFTPDANDGENHYFYPKGEGWDLSSYLFLVFDRWGARIFETTDNSVYWDGTMKGELAPQDVYVWMVKVKDIYGDNHTFEGKVTLIR